MVEFITKEKMMNLAAVKLNFTYIEWYIKYLEERKKELFLLVDQLCLCNSDAELVAKARDYLNRHSSDDPRISIPRPPAKEEDSLW